MNIRTGTLAAALVVLLLAVAAVASGCGSTSADDGVAALDDAAATTSEGDESTASNGDDEDDPQEVALAWAKCMREHGVDMPDPDFSDGGGRFGFGGTNVDPQSSTFQKAQEACQDIIEDAFGRRGPGLRVGGGAGGDDGPSTNRDEDAS